MKMKNVALASGTGSLAGLGYAALYLTREQQVTSALTGALFAGVAAYTIRLVHLHQSIQRNTKQKISIDFSQYIAIPPEQEVPIREVEIFVQEIRSPDGREKHLEFLNGLESPMPSQVLFGKELSVGLTREAISRYMRRYIVRYLHPDKTQNAAEDPEVCAELMTRFNEAKEGFQTSLTLPSIFFQGAMNAVNNMRRGKTVEESLSDFIMKGDWQKAFLFICTNKKDDLCCSIRSSWHACCIFIRSGNLGGALDYIPEEHHQAKEIFQACFERIARAQNTIMTEANCEEVIHELRHSEKAIIDASLSNEEFGEYIWKDCVPYKLYVALKSAYKLQDKRGEVEYEICLRRAIRLCPSSIKDEKLELIHELEVYLERYGQNVKDLRIEENLDWLIESSFPKFGKKPKLDKAKENLARFKQTREVCYLEAASKSIEEAKERWFWPWFNPSEENKKDLRRYARVLTAVKGYYEKDRKSFLHIGCDFQLFNEFFGWGLFLAANGKYSRAIFRLNKMVSGHPSKELRARVQDLILRAMNRCDTIYVPEGEGDPFDLSMEVTEVQKGIIETYHR